MGEREGKRKVGEGSADLKYQHELSRSRLSALELTSARSIAAMDMWAKLRCAPKCERG